MLKLMTDLQFHSWSIIWFWYLNNVKRTNDLWMCSPQGKHISLWIIHLKLTLLTSLSWPIFINHSRSYIYRVCLLLLLKCMQNVSSSIIVSSNGIVVLVCCRVFPSPNNIFTIILLKIRDIRHGFYKTCRNG